MRGEKNCLELHWCKQCVKKKNCFVLIGLITVTWPQSTHVTAEISNTKEKDMGKRKVKNQLMYLFYLCEAQGQEKNIRTGEY